MSVRPGKQMIMRIVIVMVCMLLSLTIVSGTSLVNIMIVKGDKYQSEASEQQLYDNLVTAPRGDIYDCNKKVLATSSTAWTVYLTPNGIKKLTDTDKVEKIRTTIATGLSQLLELEYDSIYEKTKQNSYYVIVKKKIEKETADQLRQFLSDNKELELTQYVGLDETTKRYYPNDTLASAVLGFVGDDNQGLAGIESYYDNDLTGVAGRVVAAKNAAGTDMPFTYQKVEEATKGHSLVLSVDSYIQYVCEKYLDAAVEENLVQERGAAIVMNVNTGDVLAMAVSGDFNPNTPFTLSAQDQSKVDAVTDDTEKSKLKNELRNRQWRNKIVSDTYEPGSVFKVFTASTGLEENLINLNSSFTCNYSINVAGQEYHCHKAGGHGTQNLSEAIAHSCNPAFITIGQLIGTHTFSKYFKAYGLTEKTGIDLPGEAASNYHKEEKMGATELASSSFGQTFNITPIQLITMVSAAVNGGYLVQPHLVNQVLDADGKVVSSVSTAYKRQVISESTSATMRQLLEFVIQNGVKNGYVAGYRVGGKTGTSEKVSKMLSTGTKGLYIASYATIAPINDPEIAVLVLLDEPQGTSYYGSTTAAPVGAKIMSDVLPYLGFEPQYSEAELKTLAISVPETKGIDIAAAKSKIATANLNYKVVGSGATVVRQLPEAGSSVYNGGTVILYTEETGDQATTVPSMIGMTATEANSAAAAAGINIEFSGNISASGLKAYAQSVDAGASVPIGTIVTVSFRDDSAVDIAAE